MLLLSVLGIFWSKFPQISSTRESSLSLSNRSRFFLLEAAKSGLSVLLSTESLIRILQTRSSRPLEEALDMVAISTVGAKMLCNVGQPLASRRDTISSFSSYVVWYALFNTLCGDFLSFNREHQDFLWHFFCLSVPKNFVGEPLSVPLISGIEKC